MNARLWAATRLFQHVPAFVANRMRTQALRASGVRIEKASIFWGMPTLVGSGDFCQRLRIGSYCGLNEGCFFELESTITLGDHVAVGHDVMFVTRTCDAAGTTGAGTAHSAHAAPIVIGDGAWLGARSTVLAGVTIGAGAVIGACVVVREDVPDNTLVIGPKSISLAKWR